MISPKTSGEVGQLKAECRTLIDECQTLKDDNKQLSLKLQQIQQQQASSNEADLALRGEGGEAHEEVGAGSDVEPLKADVYMTLSKTQTGSNQGSADASIQKNISLDGKTGIDWNDPAQVLSLRDQLRLAEDRAWQVHKQCEGLKGELAELQGLFDCSQKERAELEQDLRHCRAELARLCGGRSQSCTPPSEPPVLSIPFIGMIVIVALIWCCLEELAS